MRKGMTRTVLRPDVRKPIVSLNQYVTVPRLATIGTFNIVDMLPGETLVALSRLGKRLSQQTPTGRHSRANA